MTQNLCFVICKCKIYKKIMKKITTLFILFCTFILKAQTPTPINDANFKQAVNTCLSTNPADGMCSESEYGAMPNWDVSAVTDMSDAFRNKFDFNGDIKDWNVSNVTNMYRMFQDVSSFNQDIRDWVVRNVQNMSGMFQDATSFNQDIGGWNVSKVTNMSKIFMDAKDFNQDIGNWIVSDVTQMDQMFKNAISFNQDIGIWNTTKVTNMGGMFRNATSFNQDVSKWDVSVVSNMQFMFDSSDLSSDNYDKLLTAWSQLTLKRAVVFTLGIVNYCNGAVARERMITTYDWVITDGGLDCSTLGNEDEHLSNISIYPNPTRDKLFIQGLSNPLKVSIYNVLGKLVLAEITSKDIDVKQLSKGIYILKIIDEQKETVRKFIKN